MPIISAAEMLQDMIGPMVNTGDLGTPEAPDGWGQESGGYINDQGTSGPGGFTHFDSINRIYPWFVTIAEKNFVVTGRNFMVEVRMMRAYIRNRSSKVWSLREERKDAAVTAGGTLNTKDYNFPTGNENATIPGSRMRANLPSGGRAIQHLEDWCLHGWPCEMIYHSVANEDCYGVTMQARLIPLNDANEFDWENIRVSGNVGGDNYAPTGQYNGFKGEHAHSAFKRLTNKWQVFASASVKRPAGHVPGYDKPSQGPGLTVSEYNAGQLPIPPEEHVWLERGAFNATTNKQSLVLRRSAATNGAKVFTLTKKRGTFSVPVGTVTMASGASSVQFEVDAPQGQVGGSNTLYVTDGASTMAEDHYGTFVLGTGTATGNPSTGSSTVKVALPGFNVAQLLATAQAQPVGQRSWKYVTDVSAALGSNPFFEIVVGNVVKYRTTVVGIVSYNGSGMWLPDQFVEPASINVADALTAADAIIRIRPANGAALALEVPLNVVDSTGALKASVALDGTRLVRTSNVLLEPPAAIKGQ